MTSREPNGTVHDLGHYECMQMALALQLALKAIEFAESADEGGITDENLEAELFGMASNDILNASRIKQMEPLFQNGTTSIIHHPND